jgi:4-hydroxy-tetrahydrodipicolinate synthase
MPRFGAVLTAMITPFADDGSLDVDGAVTLARWLADHGSDGLVVAGTTGEAPTLSDAEKRELWRAVADGVTIPVVAGTGTNDTAHSIELTKVATECGAAGILAVTPYYNRPSQAGIEAHFRAIAGATELPVLIYDIPIRSGRKVSNEVLVRLANDVANVAGVKDAALDVASSARLIAAAPSSFELYSGNDDQTLFLLAAGAVGLIGVATHWAGPEFAEMIAAFNKGDIERARSVNVRLLDSYDFETGDLAPNPVPAKAMCRVMGLPAGACRLPLGPTPDGLEDRARKLLADLRG